MSKKSMMKRRAVVRGLAASSLLPLLGANLMGCSDSSDSAPEDFDDIEVKFLHGVASGDPLEDRVILWTRVTPQSDGRPRVNWEIANDATFSDVIASGSGTTSAEVDYTVKIDAAGLDAGTRYYYRFTSGNTISAVGRTRTLPVASTEAINLAVVSCSNYPAGFFHVYREVANSNVDAVLHLGDYIYEYGISGYASDRAEEFGRVVKPETEILSVSDYRTRYALYRTDRDLQAAHSAHPFFITWDDHEIANDAWREGAENHDPVSEGEYEARRVAAIQAWYEWQPVRPPRDEREIIYRRFQFGDLLDLLMLDTRIIGRDRQFNYAEFANGGKIDVEQARAAFGDTDRTLLGEAQLAWVRDQLASSNTRWQVFGQQVLMGRYWLPANILEALDPGLADPDGLANGTAAVFAALEAKNKPPEDRTLEEQALLDSAIPYNLDAWDGYAVERDDLLRYAQDVGSKLVVLAGDTHNAWSSQLTTPEGSIVGVEFGCASVSSPGLEGVLGPQNAELFAPIVATLVDDLKSADLAKRGYLYLSITKDTVQAEQRFISNIDSRDYTKDDENSISMRVDHSDMVLR